MNKILIKNIIAESFGGIWGTAPKSTDIPTKILRSTNITKDNKTTDLNNVARRYIPNHLRQKYLLQEGDIIITKSSGSPEHIGKSILIDSTLSQNDYSFANFMQLLRVDKSKITPEYFFLYISSQMIRGKILKESTTTTGLRNLKINAIMNLEIPLPSITEQKQIVSKIKQLFTLLDKSEEKLKQTEIKLDKVIDAALGSLTTKDSNKVYETTIGELVEKKETITKANLPTKFEYIEISSISNNFQIETTKQYSNTNAPSRARQLVREGNILYSTVRPNLRRIAIVPQKLHLAICSTGFCNLRPKIDKIKSKYLYYWLLREDFTRKMISLARGSQYPAVRDKDVLSSKILVPNDLDMQDEIVHKLDICLQISTIAKDKMTQIRETTQTLRQSILKKAFEGRLNTKN